MDLPAKTIFYEGEDVSLSGLLVTARYSDGLCRVVSDFDISSYDLTVGVKNITVTYQGMIAGFQIEIRANGELPETTVWVAHRLSVKQYLYSLMNREMYRVEHNGVQVGQEEALATGMILCRVETGRVVQTAKIIVAGDLNGDGVVNALDISEGKQHILANRPLADLYREALDFNQDGAANVLDLVQMKRELAGLNL